jgi:acyl-CoA reductase-like NAD-dependent aldehyde dehydrogenase
MMSQSRTAISPEALSVLASIAKPVEFDSGACIFAPGKSECCCYVIDEGLVRIEGDGLEIDSESIHGHVESGDLLGELSLIDRLPRTSSAFADTRVRARRVDAADVDELRRTRPEDHLLLVGALAKLAALKLRSTSERLADILATGHDAEVEELIARADLSQRTIMEWPEERIDALLASIAKAVAAQARELAVATVRVTRMGHVDSKTEKNIQASLGISNSLVGRSASGKLSTDTERKVTEFAAPVGVIVGLVPITNPVSTAVFKTLIAIKSRNAIVLSYHSGAQALSADVGAIIHGQLAAAGAPLDLHQWVKQRSSHRKTQLLMQHPKVGLILATGGASMVKAAYSAGKPAIGVGPANTPVLIAEDADVFHAAGSIVASKSFDNGLICGSEHNILVTEKQREAFIAALEQADAAVLTEDEAAKFAAAIIDPATGRFRSAAIGQAAAVLAQQVGIGRHHPIKIIVIPTSTVNSTNVFVREKMFPVTSLITVRDDDAGLARARELLEIEGSGHTAVIYTSNRILAERFANLLPVSRTLLNAPASQGIGGAATGLVPSFTLGCGTFGGTSTTDNVSYRNLLNIKRLAEYIARRDQ